MTNELIIALAITSGSLLASIVCLAILRTVYELTRQIREQLPVDTIDLAVEALLAREGGHMIKPLADHHAADNCEWRNAAFYDCAIWGSNSSERTSDAKARANKYYGENSSVNIVKAQFKHGRLEFTVIHRDKGRWLYTGDILEACRKIKNELYKREII